MSALIETADHGDIREIRLARAPVNALNTDLCRALIDALNAALDREGRTMTERVSVTLHNAKPQAATVHVVEPLPRWTDWEIVESTVPATKVDAQTTSFAVEVPAGGERVLEYTVRYRWAPDVQIP